MKESFENIKILSAKIQFEKYRVYQNDWSGFNLPLRL
jgi:hypothetical protein